jgi:hypothetical protein
MCDTDELDDWDNVYSAPEKFGLTIVAELEKDLSYSFDKLVVWRDANGKLYFAGDAGCSCPSPFEDYKSVESLIPIHHLTDLDNAVGGFPYTAAARFLRKVCDEWDALPF